MHKALKDLDSAEKERILNALIRYLTPQPDVGNALIDKQLGSSEIEMLEEIKKYAKIPEGTLSEESKTKVLETIVQELSKSILEGPRAKSAKARLGSRGDLRPDLYDIKFGDTSKLYEKRGIRKNHIEQVIHHPHKVEHLLPNRFSATDDMPALSLYTKIINLSGSMDAYTLLVQTTRDADKLQVDSAWRVYHSDVDLSQVDSPLDMLKAFVRVYGTDFTIGKNTPQRFLLYETLPIPVSGQPVNLINILDSKIDKFEASFTLRQSPLGLLEIAIAYVIDTRRYENDLRKHKVQLG